MKLTLDNISSGYASIDTLNSNFDAIETALENTLSRDGTSPNQMTADLDMNGHYILNELATAGDDQFIYLGDWVTATDYVVNNLVFVPVGTYGSTPPDGCTLICTTAHTSGTFSTDWNSGNGKWKVLAQRGENGAGAGNMLKSENLSGLSNYATARSNLSLTVGVDVQGYDALLTAIAAQTTAANKIQAYSGTDSCILLNFIDDDSMATASATNIPSAESVKAYVDSNSGITSGTEKSGSQAEYEWLSIPAGTKRIVVAIKTLTMGAGKTLEIQLGTSSGYTTTGYASQVATVSTGSTSNTISYSSTNSFDLAYESTTLWGCVILVLENNNTWCSSSQLAGHEGTTSGTMHMHAGTVSLPGVLDRLKLKYSSGNINGTVNISYE